LAVAAMITSWASLGRPCRRTKATSSAREEAIASFEVDDGDDIYDVVDEGLTVGPVGVIGEVNLGQSSAAVMLAIAASSSSPVFPKPSNDTRVHTSERRTLVESA
jgi:hypothetical protein